MVDRIKDRVSWYSIQEAAEIYKFHPNTIRTQIREDRIPSRQVERSGRLVYEVAISDDDAALLAHEQALERMSDIIAGLRSQLGREQAMREQAEAKAAPLKETVTMLTAELADKDERLNKAVGEIDTLQLEKLAAQNRVEERAEEIGRLQAERDAMKDRNDQLKIKYRRNSELLHDARNYYWGPGFWPAVRRIFRTYRGFSRIPY